MSRLLFSSGARGGIIEQIQQRLNAAGLSAGMADGRYGTNTITAVTAFQSAHGLTATGQIDVDTWSSLMQMDIPAVRDRALQLTAAFEGHGFTLALGNFDGAGLTWGIIGFTLRSGSLKNVFERVLAQNPDLVRQAFGANTDQWLGILTAPPSQQMAFADSISQDSDKRRLPADWLAAFRTFGSMPAVQAVQVQVADRSYFQPALQTAARYALTTELGLALCFDIHVQNGGVSAAADSQIRAKLAAQPGASQQDRREIIANAVADNANPTFRENVRRRKLTLATGAGMVNGEPVTVRNWGLDDLAV
jgi:peptidoglycan hydrolase-like protein with peptidoglycan-binding domain